MAMLHPQMLYPQTNRVRYARRALLYALIAIVALALSACQMVQPQDAPVSPPEAATADFADFEVWGFDQADTHSDGGGLLYIWSGAELTGDNPAGVAPEIIDLAEAAEAAGCAVSRRPHMGLANRSEPSTHMIIASVGSGDTFFFDVESREIVGCVNTVGGFEDAGGTVAAHASVASPDNSIVLVADMGAAGESGYLHKIQTDYAANEYQLVETLPLGDFAADLGSELAKPICHEYTEDGRHAFITMAQGGLLVIDTGSPDGSTPMTLAHAHPASVMPGAGCGVFRVSGDLVLSNGESGAAGGDDFLYIHDISGIAEGVFPDPVQIELPGEDTHGVAVCTDEQGRQYAWTVMRVSSEINIIDLETHEIVKTESMATAFSPNPSPDLAFLHEGRLFVTLRGGQPLTAINSLLDAERTPGVAMLTVSSDCLSFTWNESALLAMDSNPNRADIDGVDVSASDPHGLEVIVR